MPRRSRSSSSSRTPNRTQTRSSSTTAAPPRSNAPPMAPQAHTQQGQPRQPGLFSQMASTAAGVAVGSTIGHGISNTLFGGRNEEVQHEPQSNTYYNQPSEFQGPKSCQFELRQFTQCMEQNNNDITPCQLYLDMLKQCNSMTNSRV